LADVLFWGVVIDKSCLAFG